MSLSKRQRRERYVSIRIREARALFWQVMITEYCVVALGLIFRHCGLCWSLLVAGLIAGATIVPVSFVIVAMLFSHAERKVFLKSMRSMEDAQRLNSESRTV